MIPCRMNVDPETHILAEKSALEVLAYLYNNVVHRLRIEYIELIFLHQTK